jgi:hypothetical protein
MSENLACVKVKKTKPHNIDILVSIKFSNAFREKNP